MEHRPWQPRGYESVIEVYDQGGQLKYFLPQAVPIVDGDDKRFIGVTLVLGDVTNLRRLDEMKSGLLSVVSHELKTPLTSIRMAAHLLLEERVGPLNQKQTELLMASRDDADRLHRIIENLLDMGRLESGRGELDLRPESAEKLLSESVEPFHSSFRDRGIELTTQVAPDVPEVLVDRTRIAHVFNNLLGNALKYTPPGGAVQVSAEPAGEGYVKITIADNGCGIPAEHLPHVFERFFRVPGQSSESGAGLGLAIARDIIAAHGGQISVESSVGKGSKFSFTVRARSPHDLAVQHIADPATEGVAAVGSV
jgi:signal transduction histidine kinase